MSTAGTTTSEPEKEGAVPATPSADAVPDEHVAGIAAERVDVAVNIFAKPYQTALSVLSLLRQSSVNVGTIWLQYEPMGSRYDKVSPYVVAKYLKEVLDWPCRVSQPEHWLALEAPDMARLDDPAYRLSIRYQNAFEHSESRKLLLMHNDVYVFGDALGEMLAAMGDAFAIGQLGQCWNCPAHADKVVQDVMGRPACTPERYEEFRPDAAELRRLYSRARELGVFVRPYEVCFTEYFDQQPWPLPECRVNEWFCLLDLEKTRPHCAPFGPVLPPGAYGACGSYNLDIAVPWFRAMHALGFRARHFDHTRYLRHWVGTGKMSASRYTMAEDNARKLLEKEFPDYMAWLRGIGGSAA